MCESLGFLNLTAQLKQRTSLCLRNDPLWAQFRRFPSTSFLGEQLEHTHWDPKDGELCLARLKSGETLMEDRRDSDVQIDFRSWV